MPSVENSPLLLASVAWRVFRLATGAPLSRSVFYRWIADGRIPTQRAGARILIQRDVLDSMIARVQRGEDVAPASGCRKSR